MERITSQDQAEVIGYILDEEVPALAFDPASRDFFDGLAT